MDYDPRYQDGKDGPITKEIRDRIRFFQTLGSTLGDIGEVLEFSGSFVSQLLNDRRPGRVRTIHIPRIIKLLEDAERKEFEKTGKRFQPPTSQAGANYLSRTNASQGAAGKPQMFVASSAENVHIAYDIQESLLDAVDATVWTQGVFRLSKTTMESLVDQLPKSDFGVFVLAPDDITEMRGSQQQTVRDNVVFEARPFYRTSWSRTVFSRGANRCGRSASTYRSPGRNRSKVRSESTRQEPLGLPWASDQSNSKRGDKVGKA